LIAFAFTNASVTFLQAEATIREKVGRDIFMSFAASFCFISSRHASRIASNSSMLNTTPSSLFNGLHFGRKHLSPGRHFTHLAFFGLIGLPSSYAHWFITNFTTPSPGVNKKILIPNKTVLYISSLILPFAFFTSTYICFSSRLFFELFGFV
jgi:hypothetical protein